EAIDAASYVVWLIGLAVTAAVLRRRRIDRDADSRPAFAFAVAVALLTNPHLFVHDAVLWTIPLLLYTASLRDARRNWMPFAGFALAWPAIFLAAGRLDIRSGPLTVLDLYAWTFVAATVIIGVTWSPAAVVARRLQPGVAAS